MIEIETETETVRRTDKGIFEIKRDRKSCVMSVHQFRPPAAVSFSSQLSDKYDRERNKERDTAPHLAGSSSRLAAQSTQAPAAASRRAETREAAKKKAGETSEDWRRGW